MDSYTSFKLGLGNWISFRKDNRACDSPLKTRFPQLFTISFSPNGVVANFLILITYLGLLFSGGFLRMRKFYIFKHCWGSFFLQSWLLRRPEKMVFGGFGQIHSEVLIKKTGII